MSHSIEDRIEEIKKNCNQPTQADGFIFASIETPAMDITIGAEYIIYIQRYGPPHHGKFDQCKLDNIRDELNLPTPAL